MNEWLQTVNHPILPYTPIGDCGGMQRLWNYYTLAIMYQLGLSVNKQGWTSRDARCLYLLWPHLQQEFLMFLKWWKFLENYQTNAVL